MFNRNNKPLPKQKQPSITPSIHEFDERGVNIVTPNWIIVDAAIYNKQKEDRNTEKVGPEGAQASPKGDNVPGGDEEVLGVEPEL